MIKNIIKTQEGFRAIIDEVEMFIPYAEGNRHFQLIQEAIIEGAEVTIEQLPAQHIPNLSFAQLLIGLVCEGWLTESEADAWTDGVLPAAILALIATLPPEQQFAARTRARVRSEIIRTDALVQALGVIQGKTPEQLDQFFIKYGEV